MVTLSTLITVTSADFLLAIVIVAIVFDCIYAILVGKAGGLLTKFKGYV